jgi:coproporphyrinogen III oxidase
MFELYNSNDEVIDRWFGGGTDLTPYYLFEEDAIHFHQPIKTYVMHLILRSIQNSKKNAIIIL